MQEDETDVVLGLHVETGREHECAPLSLRGRDRVFQERRRNRLSSARSVVRLGPHAARTDRARPEQPQDLAVT